MALSAKINMLPMQHTGKLRHHRHTSWGGLFTLVGLTAMVIIAIAQPVAFAGTTDSGNFGVYGSVVQPKPSTPPTITSVQNGAAFHNADSVTIAGSCPNNTTVRIFKNEVLAGSAQCINGHYSVPIALFVGSNTLVARAYASDDAVSPDSTALSVTLQPAANQTIASTTQLGQPGVPASQFYLTTSAFQQGSKPGKTMSWTITATGGQAPYAVSVDWGDGNTQLISRGEAGQFTISHTYKHAADNGAYPIIIKATDQQSSSAYLQFVAVISPAGGVLGGVQQSFANSLLFKIGAGVLVGLLIIAGTFWLGEKRELHTLRAKGLTA